MSDLIFEHPRLVSIYDSFDGERKDLIQYLELIQQLNAGSVIDIGCGTGCLSTMLAKKGVLVLALDPAQASINYAKTKPFAELVHWVNGDASLLPTNLNYDLAVMTGNVAQVFISEFSWSSNLLSIHKALRDNGWLIFEVRDPSKKAWLSWNKEQTFQRIATKAAGWVQSWCDLKKVENDLVTFQWTYLFESSNEQFISSSTLRFRSRLQIEDSLKQSGFAISEIKDAPDRPGMEFVFIAQKKSSS
jgi:SAM-dependent methyltransferase